MKAVQYYNYGPPEVVKLEEIEIPMPKEDEIQIKVHVATVNRTDCGFRSAEYFIVRFFSGLFRPKNKTLGSEFAGEISAIGSRIQSFKVGDSVFGFNSENFGAHAEYLVMKEKTNSALAIIPDGLSYEEAAPICEGAHYAWNDIRAAKIKSGQKVLVNGATGAIGSAAVQLLKYLGAEVTAVCATENMELVQSLGPDVVIDYTKEDFTKLNQSFDVVFDAVGKSSFGKCKPILKKGGIYMSTELGYMSQNIFLALFTPLFRGKKVIFPIPFMKKELINFLKERVEDGSFKPLIDRTYPLEQIVDAYRYVETGQKVGNVVIRVQGN